MILVDTNVVSEIMKVAPSRTVVKWLNNQKSSSLCVSTVTIGEIEYGLRILPASKRRSQLKEKFERFISLAFAQRVLAYDEAAARTYGEVMGLRKEIGRPMSVPDGQIAAIARSNGFTVATRNTGNFEDCGVELIDPFLPTKLKHRCIVQKTESLLSNQSLSETSYLLIPLTFLVAGRSVPGIKTILPTYCYTRRPPPKSCCRPTPGDPRSSSWTGNGHCQRPQTAPFSSPRAHFLGQVLPFMSRLRRDAHHLQGGHLGLLASQGMGGKLVVLA